MHMHIQAVAIVKFTVVGRGSCFHHLRSLPSSSTESQQLALGGTLLNSYCHPLLHNRRNTVRCTMLLFLDQFINSITSCMHMRIYTHVYSFVISVWPVWGVLTLVIVPVLVMGGISTVSLFNL